MKTTLNTLPFTPTPRFRDLRTLIIGVTFTASASIGMASSVAWTGAGTNANWSNIDNWGGSLPLSTSPLTAARAVLASLVDGATYVNRTEPQRGVESHTFKQSDGSPVQVVWKYEGKTCALDIPKGLQALDILGNPIATPTVQIGEEPIYLVGK